ncbi:MAG: hypothetical protein A2275_06390 [Bacteroidetes bacterium RIFOXYA12_FULL_35_11]|nr:MAG: hypothetical protein A2X01_12090 [Bacteroidetes bacterium GWF2_35_48]OFY82989.1 MAG: hypothetical protein A2275_06390 [Bacteroidetes bacterium RIFOXYA12_FULL_35_11]OFY96128.1 MAG: hypothetical protein A2309_13060 [Bacteroidetes bacterium RIFOXYB2_FULL_35_7]OFZ00742.1 MAG: hypothetical protein A2491_07900 [Bacteroidetes bacterium RIFOXYC12_FULL_35_7]HBX49494.1 hypothetical protein [Bacteroidales bacterium]
MDDKLDQIIKISAGLFVKYGIRSVSMDDVAREMGMSKKTLYLYLNNKTDLVEKILEYHLKNRCCYGDFITGKKLNAIDILLEVSKEVSKNFQNFNPAVMYDLQKYYPEIFKNYMHKHMDIIQDHVIQNIEQGIEEGLYRDDLSVELIARLYLKKLEAIHQPEFLHNNEFNFKVIFEVMFESHIRGIANKKGVKYLEKQKKTFNFNIG